jgi:hypothetical protein
MKLLPSVRQMSVFFPRSVITKCDAITASRPLPVLSILPFRARSRSFTLVQEIAANRRSRLLAMIANANRVKRRRFESALNAVGRGLGSDRLPAVFLSARLSRLLARLSPPAVSLPGNHYAFACLAAGKRLEDLANSAYESPDVPRHWQSLKLCNRRFY